jgi:EAL domain-containing protein (putative c-di-GMP-specific phosphodiesterase class I)
MAAESLFPLLSRPGSLRTVFQPVTALQGGREMRFVEALTRGPLGTNLETANVLFEYARRKGKAAELDRLCARQAFTAAAPLPARLGLSLNVHASTLEQDRNFAPHLLQLADESQRAASDLIVEIVEHAPMWAGQGFHAALATLRRHGVRIALDDVGCGQSSYRMMLDCDPEYYKVDRYLVQGCHADARRQAVLGSIRSLARTFAAQVVAEGVEVAADLEMVRALDFDLVQGYLLAEPQPAAAVSAQLCVGTARTSEA